MVKRIQHSGAAFDPPAIDLGPVTAQLTCCGTVWTGIRCGKCSRRLFNDVQMVTRVPPEIRALLQARAAMKGISISQIIFEIVLDWLEPTPAKD